jgi:predicted DNA repair protein MutK
VKNHPLHVQVIGWTIIALCVALMGFGVVSIIDSLGGVGCD